jgi:hypothetical protein
MGDFCCDELKENGKQFCKFHEGNKIDDFDIQIANMIHKQYWDFEGIYFPRNMQFKIFKQDFETKRAAFL